MYYKKIKITTPHYYEYDLEKTYSANGKECFVLKMVQGKRRLPKYIFFEKWLIKDQNSNFRICSFPFKNNSLTTYLFENENKSHLQKNRWQSGLYEFSKYQNVFYGDKQFKPYSMIATIVKDEYNYPTKLKIFLFHQCYNKNWNDEKKAQWCIRNLKYWIHKFS